jgi:EmrB/QacA subfamily drug resistance transporter
MAKRAFSRQLLLASLFAAIESSSRARELLRKKVETTDSMTEAGIRQAALVVATLSAFMTPFMGSSINIALPSIAEEFGIDAVLLSWIPSSYLLATAVCLVPFGRLADIYGRKRIFGLGMVAFSLSSLLCAASFSTPMLICFRVFQGVGGAMIFSTGVAILTSVFPPQERGKVLGFNVAAVYTGLSLGPVLGGVLTHYFTWRSIFLLNIPFGIVIICLLLLKMKVEWAEAKGEKFDFIGAAIYGVAILGVIYGLSLLPSLRSLLYLIIGSLALFVFVKRALKVKGPVFDLHLFMTNRVFAFSNLTALINYSGVFALTFLLSLYLQHIKGLGAQGAGLILISQPIVMALCSLFAGRLSDKIEPRIVASAGMALITFGLLLLVFLAPDSGMGFIIGAQVVLGLGFGLFSSPNTNAIMGSVERKFYGLASGSVATMRVLGMMISMAVATLTFSVFLGRVQITPEHYDSFMKAVKAAFIVFSLLCFGGIFTSLVRGKVR